MPAKEKAGLVPVGEFADVPARGLNEKTCRKFGYFLRDTKQGKISVASYRDAKGEIVAQKIRKLWLPKKDPAHFVWRGDSRAAGLYGQHLWTPRPDSKVFLTVTEGEEDAKAVAQIQGLKYPVVSIRSGAATAKKDIAEQIEWLERFPWVVFCFDEDEPGRKAAIECAQLLTPGKARIARLPLKDATEMLLARQREELVNALFDARPYVPEGVINGADIFEELQAAPAKALVPFPWPKVEEMTGGFWPGSCTTIAAGTNAGKTPLIYNLVYHLLSKGETVGVLHTEQKHKEAALGIMQLELGQRLDPRIQHGQEQGFREAFDATVGSGRWFYFTVDDSPDELLGKVKYLIQACGCQWIIIDHLHDIISHFTGADERRFIDNFMAKLKQIYVRHDTGVFLVAQLSLPEGNKGFEHGLPVTMRHIKGAGSISQVSAVILGYERNLMHADKARVGRLRVLKNRHGGRTGIADSLEYDETTGRLLPQETMEEAARDAFNQASDDKGEEAGI